MRIKYNVVAVIDDITLYYNDRFVVRRLTATTYKTNVHEWRVKYR